ncbi:hypothetical protein RvY_12816 [Ramazzottius varieornatus]|uniref:Uncharacterized protein n=1 Tax=Ramazzottius varieornatus TaxID=947166 RepID=A0A1D1VKS7_RAMVA|nr:hypothetical protein RvY_12816 [Ramazzottius varieornatus]
MHVIWAVGQDLYNPPSAKDPPIDPMGTKMAAKPSNPDLIQARKFNRVEVEDWEKLPEDMQTDSSDVGSSLEARQGQCHRSCSKRCVAQEGQLTRCRTTCTKRCLVGDEDTDEDVANTTTRSSAFRSTTVPSVPDHTTTATFNTTTTVDTAIEATTIPSTLGSVVPTKTRRNRITNRNKKLSPDGEVVWLAIFQETG